MESDFLLLILGLAVLAKFSAVVVDAAAKLSQITGISKIFIGFIFIGLATSLPELSIGIISSFGNNGALSVGNLLGANITNLTLILGLMAFIGFNLGKIYSSQLKRAIAVTMGIAIMLMFIGSVGLLFGAFLLCIYYLFSAAIMKEGLAIGEQVYTFEAAKAGLKMIVSVIVVIASAYVATNSAVALAASLGMSSAIIGATIISIGTTMPELSVNIAAVRKRNISLAIGNTVGTITTNLAMVLGVVAMINPVIISAEIILLASVFAAICAVVYVLASRLKFGIKEGLLLASIYVIYISSVLLV